MFRINGYIHYSGLLYIFIKLYETMELTGISLSLSELLPSISVYPLDRVANPPVMNFVNISGKNYNRLEFNDATVFEEVAQVVREEPLEAVDPETRGVLATIGIRKDQPFLPDDRMKRILKEAAAVGNATVRAISFSSRNREMSFYPGSAFREKGQLDPDHPGQRVVCHVAALWPARTMVRQNLAAWRSGDGETGRTVR
jgi:hypothetical protein